MNLFVIDNGAISSISRSRRDSGEAALRRSHTQGQFMTAPLCLRLDTRVPVAAIPGGVRRTSALLDTR